VALGLGDNGQHKVTEWMQEMDLAEKYGTVLIVFKELKGTRFSKLKENVLRVTYQAGTAVKKLKL
jgi:hypothetical protein